MARSVMHAIRRGERYRRRSVAIAATLAMAIASLGLALPGVAGAKPVKTISFSAATYSARKADTSATITVSRSSGSGKARVNFATSDGTATAGTDYTATSTLVQFKSGQTSQTVTVPLLNGPATDDVTINLTLSGPSKGWSLGTQGTAVLTIKVKPATPTVTATGDSYDVYLSWGADAKADGFVVSRSTTAGGPYTQIGTPTTNWFIDPTVDSGTTYYYVVKATSADRGDSADSSEVSGTTTSNLLSNGGFETGDFTSWTIGHGDTCLFNCTGRHPHTMFDPSIDTGTVLGGSDSAFLGDPISPCTTEGQGYAFLYQDVAVPATGTTTLTWYYNGQSQDPFITFDVQQVLILDTSNGLLATLQNTLDRDRIWKRGSADLTAYAGSTVRVYFRVYEDGFGLGDCTGLNVDNVSVSNE